MDATELAYTSALEQADLLVRGEVSAVELVEVYLARIAELNPVLNSYITVAADFALETARAADGRRAAGGDLPPFLGVPISIKDLADTAGIVSTHGTAEWHDRVPDHDDEVVARLRAAGFVILGKTVVPEFGPLNISEPPGYPPGRNPWNPALSSGGSSGGAAAALVAGMCPASHGSDGGGSIRNPSSWCGAFGLKPQRGRVSRAPNPQNMFSIDGPITRTVADAAALLDVMSGYVNGDAYWAPPPTRPFADEVAADPGRLRIAFHPHPGVAADECAPANRRAAEDAAKLLADLGHDVAEAVPPGYLDGVAANAAAIFAAEHAAAAELAPYPPLDTLDPWMKTLVEMGRLVPAVEYVKAMQEINEVSRRTVAFFDDYDLFVSPTLALPPPRVGSMSGAGIDEMLKFLALTPFTPLWNTTGQPAASVPLAHDDDGLPVGVQVVGRPAAEATIIRVCAQLEHAQPWRERRPAPA
ncbi:MAG TPA: amidase [Acidimicrobiia bacterium]